MAIGVTEQLLDERLAALERARSWSPRLIAKFEATLRGEGDHELFRLNLYRFAADKAIEPAEAIDLFLHAAAHNLLVMDWLLVCPGCSCAVSGFRSLHTVESSFHCNYCIADWTTTLDDYIMVAFTVASDLRQIIFHHPETLSVEDYCFHYHVAREGLFAGGQEPFAHLLQRATQALAFLPPRQTVALAVEARSGVILEGWSLESDARLGFRVEGEPSDRPQIIPIQVTGHGCQPAQGVVAPGPVVFELTSLAEVRGHLGIAAVPEGLWRGDVSFAPYLSGQKLVTTQTFRDLFRSEVVGNSEGIGVRDVTLLFTDLKGSTALYDQIGDLNAFSLVQQHFESLRAVTAAHGGAVVKTIGDAVMAAFADPDDAVAAALAMRLAIERCNRDAAKRDLVLKLGIHRGAAIAVTLNDRLDYFGQTANIAARVQGLAESDEICISVDVYDDGAVRRRLQGLPIDAQVARLRGVGQEMTVYRIAPDGVATRMVAKPPETS